MKACGKVPRIDACQRLRRQAFPFFAVFLLAGAMLSGPPWAALASAAEAPAAAEQICFVFTGSRQSELESCGCTDRQAGGVDREAFLYDKLRKTYPHVIAMDAGGWTDPLQSENERLKTGYLVRAMHDMGFEAYNVTPYDLALGTTYPAQLVANNQGRLLSANVKIRPRNDASTAATSDQLTLSPYTIFEVPRNDNRRPIRVGVLGLTHPSSLDSAAVQRLKTMNRKMPDCEVLGVSETLKAYIPQLRRQADFVIVLAMMDSTVARQLSPAEADGIDLFVTTYNTQSYRTFIPWNLKTLITTGFWGRYFSQAVVEFDGENRPTKISGELTEIPSDGPPVAAFSKLLEQYREKTKKLSRRIAVALEQSRYAGRNQCINCHGPAYLQWVRTPHNLAYATLAQKNQHYNPDCLPCHVTGYYEPDGFADAMQTGHLVSVQCEVCHGPARAHVRALTEMMRPDPDGKSKKVTSSDTYPHLTVQTSETLCLKCHNSDHDPNFNYQRDLRLISHKNVTGPFRRKEAAEAPPKPAQPIPIDPRSLKPLPTVVAQ